MSGRVSALAWLLLAVLTLIWGSSFILIKVGIKTFDPFTAGMLRLTVASLFMVPISIYHFRKVQPKDWPRMIAMSLVGVGLPSILFPWAQKHVDSAVAGIGNSLSPFWVLVLGALFFGRKFSGAKVIGVLVGLAGAVMLVLGGSLAKPAPGNDGGATGFQFQGYELLLVLATICYGLSTNLIKDLLTRYPSSMVSAYQVSLSGVIAMVVLLPGTPFLHLMQTQPHAWESLAAVATLGAFGTALAVILFSRMVQLTDTVFSSSVTYLMPLVAVVWGLAVGEHLHWMQWVGMVVILSGVGLVNFSK